MNEFNDSPGAKPSTPAARRGSAARAEASNPGVEPRAAPPPPPPPPFSNRPVSSQERAARPVSYADQYPTTSKENAMDYSNKTRTGLSLLGGAGLGAVLMYLLDPDQGRARREELAHKAGHAKDATAAALAAALEVAREKGQSASQVLSEKLAEYGSAGAETASGVTSRAGRFTSRLMGRASETGRSLGKTSRRYTESARDSIGGHGSWFGRDSWFGREQRSYVPSTGSALGAVACLAAGFGLMYLIDPSEGRRRRAVARDKTMKWLREIGDMSRKTGRHLANKSKGYAHETAKAARGVVGEGSTVGSLADRIRSRIGALGRGQNVNVDADDSGNVTLSGECAPDDMMLLVTEVQSIPGVASLDNRMNARTGAAAGMGQ